ncbi:MAG: lipopolysaccharide biosynthesis protein [Prevotella sp.]|nr:lipopolysaccharide biosynthesis protein [Prevotella sp.]MDY3851953.1 lipopolysaccharide biosynthesis protein [Prevotella sp.]
MVTPNIKEQTISGVIWKFFEKFSIHFIVFIQSIIMARLLSPSDYGLIGMVTILNGICATLVDAGLTNALIRKKKATSQDFSTVFVFNVVMNLLMAGVMVICAPFLADFYSQPILKNIIYLFAVQGFSGALLAVQGAKMITNLQFKTLGLINVITTIATGIVSITLAFTGWGVYALVIPNIVMIYIRFGLYYYYQHWFPGFYFSKESFTELFGYGSRILASNLLNVIFGNIYSIIIGKKFSAASLGYYTRGEGYATLPSSVINDVIKNVTFPVLSKIQDNIHELTTAYRRMLRITVLCLFPLMILLVVLAHPLVVIMISDKWVNCIVFLQILCFSAMLQPVVSLAHNLLQIKGRSDVFLRITILQKLMLIVIVLATVPLGIIYMCVGSVLLAYLTFIVNCYYIKKEINLGYIEQLKDLLPSFFLSLIMGGIVYFICSLIEILLIKICVGFVLGLLLYGVMAKYFVANDFLYVQQLLKERFYNKFYGKDE